VITFGKMIISVAGRYPKTKDSAENGVGDEQTRNFRSVIVSAAMRRVELW